MNLSDLKIPDLENKIGEWIVKCDDAANAWAQTKVDYENHEEGKKILLATIIKELSGSYAAKESEAYAHPKFAEWVEINKILRRDYLASLANYEMAKLRIDCIRSLLTTRREELKRFVS